MLLSHVLFTITFFQVLHIIINFQAGSVTDNTFDDEFGDSLIINMVLLEDGN